MGLNGVDAKLKGARENLVANFLIEEDGKNKNKTQKKYVDLTTPQLFTIVESLSVRLIHLIRLNLFNGQYPAFMPHAIRAVMEHPNLTKADYEKLDGFCKIFELDWRGDRLATNKARARLNSLELIQFTSTKTTAQTSPDMVRLATLRLRRCLNKHVSHFLFPIRRESHRLDDSRSNQEILEMKNKA